MQDLVSYQEMTIPLPPPALAAQCLEIWIGFTGGHGQHEAAMITNGGGTNYISYTMALVYWPVFDTSFNVGNFNGPGYGSVMFGSWGSAGDIQFWNFGGSYVDGSVLAAGVRGTPAGSGLYTDYAGDVDDDGTDDLVWLQVASNFPTLNVNLIEPSIIQVSTNGQTGDPTLYWPPVWIGVTSTRIDSENTY